MRLVGDEVGELSVSVRGDETWCSVEVRDRQIYESAVGEEECAEGELGKLLDNLVLDLDGESEDIWQRATAALRRHTEGYDLILFRHQVVK